MMMMMMMMLILSRIKGGKAHTSSDDDDPSKNLAFCSWRENDTVVVAVAEEKGSPLSL
jgi:hypothetical protein